MVVRPRTVAAICAMGVVVVACAPSPPPSQLPPSQRAADPESCGTGSGGAAAATASGVTDTVGAPLEVLVAALDAAAATDTGLVSITSVRPDGAPEFRTVAADDAVMGALGLDAAVDADVVAVSPTEPVSLVAADDPLRPTQWAFDDASYEAAWDCGTGAGVTVAVLDTGVDTTHPEFAGRVTAGPRFVGSAIADPTGGRDDAHGHGTHVAGTVAAAANNGQGVAGVAPGASLLSVQVLDESGSGLSSGIAAGITWSVQRGADVINLSLGGPSTMPDVAAAIEHARSNGVVVVAAAGNDGSSSTVSYPARHGQVVAVGAHEIGRTHSAFSNRGPELDVSAPGSSIRSTQPGGTYSYKSGTSMAAPHVAGVAALMLDAGIAPEDVPALIVGTADDAGAPGFDIAFGWGVLDPRQAVR